VSLSTLPEWISFWRAAGISDFWVSIACFTAEI
jgi:hypothetical protein